MIRRINARRSGFLRSALLLGTGAVVIAMTVTAAAQQSQSPAQLRRENDALRERIIELEAEIAQAGRRIDALTHQLAQARAQLDRPTTGSDNSEPETPQNLPGRIPDDRFACPMALRKWLSQDYDRQFKGNPNPTRTQLAQWERRAALERATVVWDVRMLGWKNGNSNDAKMICFDRETDENLCASFLLPLSDNEATKLRSDPNQSKWTIEGVLAATTDVTFVTIGDENDKTGRHPVRTVMDMNYAWTLSIRSLEPFSPDDSDRDAVR